MSQLTPLDPSAVAANLMATPAATAAPAVSYGPAPVPVKDRRPWDSNKFKSRPDGTPFVNRQGYYMPKGGKKPLRVYTAVGSEVPSAVPMTPPAEPDQPAPEVLPVAEPSPAPAAAPVAPEVPAWSAAEQAEAGKAAAGSGMPGAAPAPDAETGVDNSADAADVGCNVLYFIVGLIFDAHEEATPGKAEHENFVRTAAAYIRTTGWRATAGIAFLLRCLAYVLSVMRKPKAAAKVREYVNDMMGRGPMKNVTPKPDEPAPAAAPASPAAGGPSVSFSGLVER